MTPMQPFDQNSSKPELSKEHSTQLLSAGTTATLQPTQCVTFKARFAKVVKPSILDL